MVRLLGDRLVEKKPDGQRADVGEWQQDRDKEIDHSFHA